jgi:hypothetical protein
LLDRLSQQTARAGDLRRRFNQVLPTHWSQLIAGITTASLVVMLLTRGLLALYFDPSMGSVTYDGPFDNLRGIDMTRAYASVLHVAFEVRGGLLVLQVHAWAASLFVGSLLVHLAVMFFTGGFRRPHRPVWTVTVLLLIAGILTAFTGVLLGADMLSDTSLRTISGYILSAPVVGHRAALDRVRRRVPRHRGHPARLRGALGVDREPGRAAGAVYGPAAPYRTDPVPGTPADRTQHRRRPAGTRFRGPAGDRGRGDGRPPARAVPTATVSSVAHSTCCALWFRSTFDPRAHLGNR